MSTIKELEENLLRHKIKPTAMRLLALEFLVNKAVPVSLTDICKAFEKSDRVTLYRTLKSFEENGLIHTINDGTSTPKYALCSDACNVARHDDAHIHFHCDQCGQTFCLPDFIIPGFELPKGFNRKEVNLVVKGTCPDCK